MSHKTLCCTSQLKYVFRLVENVSRVVGQDSRTPYGEQNSLKNNMNFRLTRDQAVRLTSFTASQRKANDVFAVFSTFEAELAGITKHLMSSPAETVSFVSPRPQFSPRRALGVSRKQNSLFLAGPAIKCLLSYYMACSERKMNQILRCDWLLLQTKATHF